MSHDVARRAAQKKKRRRGEPRIAALRQAWLNVEPLEEMDLLSGPDDYGDTFATAEPLTLVQQTAVVEGTIGVSGDVDMFQLVAPRSGTLSIRQDDTSGTLDSFLRVLNPSGTELASNDDSGGTFNSFLEIAVAAEEELFIEAGGLGTSTGGFRLTVILDDFGDTTPTATDLPLDGDGSASISGVVEVAGDLDYFRIVAGESGLMVVEQDAAAASELDTFLRVYDDTGHLLVDNDDLSSSSLNGRVEFHVAAGQVVFVESGGSFEGEVSDQTGAYELSISTLTDEVRDTLGTATPLVLDGAGAASVNGAIELPHDLDVYSFVASSSGLIAIGQFTVRTSDLDSFLRVYDAGGNLLAFDDDTGTFVDSFLTVAVVAGETYYVEAGAFATATGTYTLSLRTPVELAISAEHATVVSGEIEFFGDPELYRIVAPASGQLTIEQAASAGSGLDSFLAVFDAFGNLVVSHDGDPPLFIDSRVIVDVQAGQVLFVQAGAFFDSTGAYDLTFTVGVPPGDDFADTFADAAPLDLGSHRQSSVTGTIERVGDVDVFRLGANAAGTLTIRQSANDSALDSFLQVFDSSGNLIAASDDTPGSVDSQVQLDVVDGQELFIQAGAFGSSIGRYNLGVSLSGDGGGVTLVPLAGGETVTLDGTIDVPFDVDVYQITAPITGVIRIQQNAQDLDSLVRVFDAAGNLLAVDDDSGPGVNSELLLSVAAGETLLVQAEGYLSSTGDYQLIFTASDSTDDYGNSSAAAHALSLDAVGQGSIQGNLEIEGDRDVFRIVATVSGQLAISLDAAAGSSLDAYLEVFDNSGSPDPVSVDDDGGQGLNSLVIINVQAGDTLLIHAQGLGSSFGRYGLRVTTTQVAADSVPDSIAEAEQDPASQLGQIGSAALVVAEQIGAAGDSDVYRLVVQTDGLLVIQQNAASGSPLDSFLTVYNAAQEVIAANDDSDGTLNSLVQVAVRAGDVLFARAGAYGSSVGGYRLTAQVQPLAIDDHGDILPIATPLGSAASVNVAGQISAPSDVDVFQYVAARSGQLLMTQNAAAGSSLDSFLRIFDAMGQQIAFDDDGGDGLNTRNSRLSISVTAGQVLFVQAGAFGSGTRATGAYELSLNLVDSAVNDGVGDTLAGAPQLPFDEGRVDEVVLQAANFDLGLLQIDVPQDVDTYRIEVPFDGLLTITQAASGSTLDSFLRVFDASGRQIAANDDDGLTLNSRVTLDVKAGDVLYLQAGAFGQSTGAYRVFANLLRGDVPNQLSDAAPAIELNDAGTATVEGRIEVAGDQDVFQFTASQDTVLEIRQLRSASGGTNTLDAFLRVFNGDGGLIAANDDVNAATRDSRLLVFVAAGDQIFIQAGAFGSSSGDYLLRLTTVRQDDVGNTIGTAGQMNIAGVNEARINSVGDIDWFRFTAETGGQIDIQLVLPETGAAGAVFTATRVSLLDGLPERFARSVNGRLSFDTTAGQTYFIRVQGLAEGSYQLLSQFTAGEIDAPKQNEIQQLGLSVLDAARTTFAAGQDEAQITQAVIGAFLAQLQQAGGDFLVIWLDPVDFTLTQVDASGGLQFGSSAVERTNELGNVFYSGNNVVEVLIIPNPAGVNSLALTGLGQNVRGAATFVTGGQVVNTVAIPAGQLDRGTTREVLVARESGTTSPILDPRSLGGSLGGSPQVAASGTSVLNTLAGAAQTLLASATTIVAVTLPVGIETMVSTTSASQLTGQLVVALDGTQFVAFALPEGLGTFRLSIAPTQDLTMAPGPILEAVEVQRTAQQELLVLKFDRDLDPQQALAGNTYQLVWAGPNGKLGDADDQTLELKADDVQYDAEKHQVTLRIKLPAGQYQLQIKPVQPQAGNEPATNEGAALAAEWDRLLANWPMGDNTSSQSEIDTAEALLALNEAQLDRWFEGYSATSTALLGLGAGAGMLVWHRPRKARRRNDRLPPRQPR